MSRYQVILQTPPAQLIRGDGPLTTNQLPHFANVPVLQTGELYYGSVTWASATLQPRL